LRVGKHNGANITFSIIGSFPGNKTIRAHETYWSPNRGEFLSHKISSGLNSFYEGFNITGIATNVSTYDWDRYGDFRVVANSSLTYPLVVAMNKTS